MDLNNFIKKIQNEMRTDAGINGDAQRLEQIVWLLFLKVYDAKEQEWMILDDNYQSIIPEECKWDNWAKADEEGKVLTGDQLLDFVNNTLFPTLKNLPVKSDDSKKKKIVKSMFEDVNNYMKDGIALRKVINIIDEINFNDSQEIHSFGYIYEELLRSLQSAGNSGEFYTPRALTDFIAKTVNPTAKDKIADLACGTGGFLTSAIKVVEENGVDNLKDRKVFDNLYGIEKKPLPYLLCVTNMLLHDVDNPNIDHTNSLGFDTKDFRADDKFDVILMNPPYGGKEDERIQKNFSREFRSKETADLFMVMIMKRLKKNGRAAVVLPDGFLFGDDNAKKAIKKELLTKFNLHTIIRLPKTVFSPYTDINTNVLFFDNTQPTQDVWYYRFDMPEGYKAFSKTKPLKLEHLECVTDWWNNRKEIEDGDNYKSRKYSVEEIIENNYNLDLCGYPSQIVEIKDPIELMNDFVEERNELIAQQNILIQQIREMLEEK